MGGGPAPRHRDETETNKSIMTGRPRRAKISEVTDASDELRGKLIHVFSFDHRGETIRAAATLQHIQQSSRRFSLSQA